MEDKIKKILGEMSIEEKIAQLSCVERGTLVDNEIFSKQKACDVLKNGAGHISPILRPYDPSNGTKIANEIQKIATSTGPKVPVIIHDECLHGCMAKGSTSFPQAIGLASSWDPDMVEKIAQIIGKETRVRGIHQALSPTINIARDARHGRVEETYGEDPYLTSLMAVAFIKGLQSQKVIATPKHFAADFAGDGGRDSSATFFSERILREVFFPAFKASIQQAKAWSLMAAYNSINGIPSSSNKWLLTDVLRKEWGFNGFVVSDYGSVWGIYGNHRVADSLAIAGKLALEAGLDIEIPNSPCFSEMLKLAMEGKVSQSVIDQAVERVLRGKFWLGLFENPFSNPEKAEKICDCDQHRQMALEAAEKCMVLLKNNGILPLNKDIGSVAVIGPNANIVRLGGYSGFGIKTVTVFEGIKNKISKRSNVYFAEGCRVNDSSKYGFSKASSIASKADVAIVVVGNSSETEGENRDRCNLDLPGVQEDLIKTIADTGTPVVVVLINGSAITMSRWIGLVDAVVEAWYPGEEGGNAIANVLFGNCNPGGKLPITFPVFTGQLPLYYNHLPCVRRLDYVEIRGNQPMFPFGYGLSYTDFEYKNLKISPEEYSGKGNIKLSVEVENTGKYEGDETIQLYLRDIVSSVIRPVLELKRFKKVHLKPGEKTTVDFSLSIEDLMFLDEKLNYVIESGTFEVMVGKNSMEGLKTTFEIK
ncbi:MAG: Periplasmic beta-glucosidase precursor [candidate division TA06 bacterium ADurb.Bin131]|uniref:Periplasmic beta-glucosidase n=1 Tax=candidate division TA06 bacterium ADurb.Bin131 TaxID=1852827 RepID=A0A1V6CDT2_UNCT6|nr:MAG: Periplasmic beta-glucosidase precursor [candidate division TA06 bacterium ADurb.Bin131]